MLRCLLSGLILAIPLTSLISQITLSGRLLDEVTQQPLAGAQIRTSLPDQAITDENGLFRVLHIGIKDIRLELESNGRSGQYGMQLSQVGDTNLGDIYFHPVSTNLDDQELPTITLEDEEAQDASGISGLLHSGEDVFSRITSYTFGSARFNRRGLESEYTEGYLNYFPINDLESGGVYWSNWGGLNDVMRQNDEMVGAEMAEWGFGGLNSTFQTDLRASVQWKQKRISYSITNRNYRNRIMATWSTGLTPSGWALSVSGSRRWSQEGFIPGTFYDGWAYFVSVEKKISEHHSLNLVALGSPYKRGGNSTSTQEMYDLAGDHYYNSFWGYQQGEKRNSRVYSGHQPMFILRHDWQISDKASVITALGYQTGKSNSQAMDWLFANDPRPDYYRRLPSYTDNEVLAAQIRNAFENDPSLLQLPWDDLYQINLNSHFTVEDVDGVEGQDYSGALSHYILEDRRSDIDKKSANVVLQYLLGQHSKIHIGGTAILQDTRNYKEVADLLGGEFYLDWDKYAVQDFPGNEDALQNDLLRPNRIVREGDQFGYDFDSKIRQYSGWFAYSLDTRKWELGLSASLESQVYWRNGNTKNGKFPANSYGAGEKHDFQLPLGKVLIRYKIDGRNYITVSGMKGNRAPTFRNAYVSPRTRDNTVEDLITEQVTLGEIRYDLRSPYLKAAVSGFYATSKNGIESTSFYHDDLRTFVNFSLTGIDKKYTGMEAAVEYTLFPGFSLQGAAAVGEYIYTSRPRATVTQDNDGNVLQQNITIYAKNLYVSSGPQEAYTVGFSYRNKKFWALYVNVNRFEENWINFNPLRRTAAAVDLVEYGSEQWNSILKQEKTDGAWTLDISLNKSWLVNWIEDRATLYLNIGVTNVLNNEDYINGGYEQYRFDYINKDVSAFPSRYSYMQGLNYFIQASLRF